MKLNNPITTASGCFGNGLEYKGYFDPNELGSMALKAITLEPRKGNSGKRIAATPSGILNSIGLENIGLEALKTKLPDIKKSVNIPFIGNINGKTVEEYVELAKKVNDVKELEIIELNISCPNVKDGGMAFGAKADMAAAVTKEVRKVLKKPLIVKLSPNVTDVGAIAKAVENEGADALSLINTLLGISIDIRSKKPLLGNVMGGLSGPAVKPIALRMVYQVAQNSSLPIVGMGGISTTNDALEFMMAGASIVSIGTAFFGNPMTAVEIKEGLIKYAKDNKLSNISDIVAIAHKDDGKEYRRRIGL